MKRFVLYRPNGEVVQTVTTNDGDGVCAPGLLALSVPAETSAGGHYVQGGDLIPLPPRPSDRHKFNYATKQWEPDTALAESQVKAKRNQLLAASDWTQLPDVPLATKEAWATYRQALRDITDQPGYPLEVVWPVAPG